MNKQSDFIHVQTTCTRYNLCHFAQGICIWVKHIIKNVSSSTSHKKNWETGTLWNSETVNFSRKYFFRLIKDTRVNDQNKKITINKKRKLFSFAY